MTTGLEIRNFVKGKDEETWLKIRNEAFKEYDDFRPATMEDMETQYLMLKECLSLS